MSVFTLRSSSTASALRSATPDHLRKRTFAAGWQLLVNGSDYIDRIPLEGWRISDPGPGATGRLEADHIDQSRSYSIPAGAFVELVDGDGEEVVWAGYVASRELLPSSPAGTITRLNCVHLGSALDTAFIPSDSTDEGITDRAAVQYLVSRYGLRGLRAPDVTVEVTDTSLAAQTFTNLTLRQALRQVADAAGEDREVWVDALGRLNYAELALNAAPYAITDSSPNGTTSIAANELSLESDESGIINALWVTDGETYGAWVEDSTSIATYGRRSDWLTNKAVVDSVTASLYALASLAKTKDPAIRGSAVVEGYDGWAAGQVLTVTSTPLGLSGATYQIKEVTTTWQTPTARRRYEIQFGELSRSLVRAIQATIG